MTVQAAVKADRKVEAEIRQLTLKNERLQHELDVMRGKYVEKSVIESDRADLAALLDALPRHILNLNLSRYLAAIGADSTKGRVFFELFDADFTQAVNQICDDGGVLLMSRRQAGGRNDSLLLAGVMMNAFCSACIMFLISLSQSSQVHHILFWLMGDLTMAEPERLWFFLPLVACFFIIYIQARPMNLLLTGEESAAALGLHVTGLTWLLLGTTSFMVSLVVSQAGLVGFVGLVVPHFFRLLHGPDHRILVPACILGGGAYLVICDLLARALPSGGEMPVGVVTALIGAPLFIFLLWREKR